MTSITVQETKASLETTMTTTSTSSSPLSKFRQIAPAPTEKPEYDVYHVPKGYEVFLVSKNNNSVDNFSNTTDSSPIPLSPTCSISSASSNSSSSPKLIAPTSDDNNNKKYTQSTWRRRKNNGHIPRPKNCFMAYREHMQHKVLAENPGMNNKVVSVITAKMWNQEPEDVKQYWRERAQQLKLEHMAKYPDYKFAPKKKATKNLNNVDPTGLKTSKTISKKSSPHKIINEEFARGLLRRDEFDQSIDYPTHNENSSGLWGHCRSNSVESVCSWTSSDSLPNTPPTFCERSSSPLRYETSDWNKMYDFSSLNSSPHLTAVSNSASGYYDTLLPPPMLPTDYDNTVQMDSTDGSYYNITEDEDNYDEFLQHDSSHLLDSFVLPSQQAPMHQLY